MELVEFAHLDELVHIVDTDPPMVLHEKWVKGQEYESILKFAPRRRGALTRLFCLWTTGLA